MTATPQLIARRERGESVEQYYECDGRPVLKAKIARALVELNKREPQRREEYADAVNANEKRRRVRFHPDGTLIRIDKFPGWEPYENDKQSVRGKCQGFYGKSRHRFQILCASLDRKALPLFVTLTYPQFWPDDNQDWKHHLNVFSMRLARKYPGSSFIWKMEFQERGAPHFHLLLFGTGFVPYQWIARVWWEICGTGDEDHLKAGTSVQKARSFNGVMSYVGKKYLGKTELMPAGVDCGRLWGVYGRQNLPRSRVVEVECTKRTHLRFHRLLRRFMQSKGLNWKSGGGVTLFTNNHLQWLRAFEWAETGDTGQPLDHREAYERQPF